MAESDNSSPGLRLAWLLRTARRRFRMSRQSTAGSSFPARTSRTSNSSSTAAAMAVRRSAELCSGMGGRSDCASLGSFCDIQRILQCGASGRAWGGEGRANFVRADTKHKSIDASQRDRRLRTRVIKRSPRVAQPVNGAARSHLLTRSTLAWRIGGDGGGGLSNTYISAGMRWRCPDWQLRALHLAAFDLQTCNAAAHVGDSHGLPGAYRAAAAAHAVESRTDHRRAI